MFDLTARTCVVTGATSGIGCVAARALAAAGANLVLVGRNHRAGRALVRGLHPQSAGKIEFVATDLSRPGDVRALAARVDMAYPHVDVLINNAGARFDSYFETDDGVELTFATNHLGHFLLTDLLLDRLLRAPAARVITVTSVAHRAATADGDWSLPRAAYDRRVAYAKSKLANVLFAFELAERLRGTSVTSNAVDPGIVATNFARNNGTVAWLRHLVGSALGGELISPRKGAETLVYLAGSDRVAGVTGKLFRRNREVDPAPAARDRTAARRLWDLSANLLGRSPAIGQIG